MDAGRTPTRLRPRLPPALFAGRLDLREEPGRGAFAAGYRALDVTRQADPEPRAVERFRREAAVLERLRHPNVVLRKAMVEAVQGQPRGRPARPSISHRVMA